MSAMNGIPTRDLELLSAYLDQQLSPRERAHLQTRLKDSPELRDRLEELRQTRAALRSLPHLRAPRNFILKAELAGARPVRRVYPAFGLVYALSSILLVLVLIGDFLWTPKPGSPPPITQSIPAQEAAVEAVKEIEVTLQVELQESAQPVGEEAPSPLEAPAEPVEEEVTSLVLEERAVEEEVALDFLQVETMEITPGLTTSAIDTAAKEPPMPSEGITITGAEVVFTATMTIVPEDTATPWSIPDTPTSPPGTATPSPEPPSQLEPTPVETIRPLPTETATPYQIEPTQDSEERPPRPGLPTLRIAEIVLAIIALTSGIGAILLRRGSPK